MKLSKSSRLDAQTVRGLLLSASGSLPLHFMPILIAATISQGLLQKHQAGLMLSIFIVGQLSATFTLAVFHSRINILAERTRALICLSIGLALCALIPGWLGFVGWFLIGASCGYLHQFGTFLSASSSNPSASLGTRLAFVLMFSGCIVALTTIRSAAYHELIVFLTIGFVLISLSSFNSYKKTATHSEPVTSFTVTPGRSYAGLILVLLFFVGQPGFWAFSIDSARVRGVDITGLIISIAAAKCGSAACLWYAYQVLDSDHLTKKWLALFGFMCVAGMIGMSTATQAVGFFIAMLFWEIGLNLISPKLQGIAIEYNELAAKRWLTVATLTGMSIGPAIHGSLLAQNLGWIFLTYAAATAFMPLMASFMLRRQKAH
jgi:hypothetical protein